MYSIVFSREASREYDSLAVRIQDQIDQKLTLLEKGDFALLNIDKMH